MRRHRHHRGRVLQFGVLILVYSAIHAYSNPLKDTNPERDDIPDTDAAEGDLDPNTSINPGFFSTKTPLENEGASGSPLPSTLDTITSIVPPTQAGPIDTRGSYRPKRNCTPRAIDQFPDPLLSVQNWRRTGLAVHTLVAIFTFLGLAIVCDDYFVSSLDRICEGNYLLGCSCCCAWSIPCHRLVSDSLPSNNF